MYAGLFPEDMAAVTRSVRFIYEDRQGDFWFCDEKEGVVKMDPTLTRFNHYTTQDFLPSNSVMGILEDEEGGKWFSTQKGLLYYRDQEEYKLFSLYDGIPGYVFNSPVQRGEDGSFWWGNEQGLVSYSSGKTIGSSPKKRSGPVITTISVAGKTLVPGEDNLLPLSAIYLKKLTIPFSKNSFEINFSSLNYPVENSEIYEYMLEGYDAGWQKQMIRNRVSYTNIPAGRYIFRIRTGSVPEAITSLEIKIRNNRIWILLSCLIGLLCFMTVIFFYSRLLSRYRKIKALARSGAAEEESKEKYSRFRMEPRVADRIAKKLTSYMESEKPYLNPDLKLQDIAGAIGCSSVELSQLLNLYMECGFTDYINKYRTQEFIEKVQNKSAIKYTLTTLSEQCGFSSRTSFFRSFKKLTGKTPAEYIKEKGLDIRK
ncbi:MAG: helix-turn-helix domain-containing protein [Bacteroides sp.]|nr:helix-turn-helix domain-containing protein [Bacteroides sp.]